MGPMSLRSLMGTLAKPGISGPWPLLLVLGALLSLGGCAGQRGTEVWVTRLRDSNLVSRTKLPICISNESDNLVKRERMNICIRAIKKQGIAIARADDAPCLAATLTFKETTIGQEGECTSYPFGAPGWVLKSECSSHPVQQYSLKLVLADPDDEKTVLESYVVTDARVTNFNSATISALCGGAFHKHPQVIRGELVRLNAGK
jgi:hypothetical protein